MRVHFSEGTDRLTRAYPTLSPQLKRCAAYILEHPSEVATLSMRQVAARASVPPSTLNRLAQALDFRTYNEFRALYRDSINQTSSGYAVKAGRVHVVARESDLDDVLDEYQRATVSNIGALFDRIDRSALERAVGALADARNVLVIGTHESHSLANYLHAVAAIGFRNWYLVTRHDGELSHLLGDLRPADAVVCIASEPYATDTVRTARRAREAGARVVGITDRRTSPVAACADEILLFPAETPGLFRSHVGATALAEMLVGMVVARSGQSMAEHMEKLDRVRREMGEYWNE